MAINFPNLPSLNQQYTDSTSGTTYSWDGYKWVVVGLGLNYVSRTGDSISGPLLLSNGSLASPALAFSASTNSGFYITGTGFGMAVLGQHTLAVDVNRRIGVNTTTPLDDLDVRNPSSSATVRIQSSAGNRFRVISDSSGTNDFYSESSSGTAAASRFFVGATEAFRVDTSARMGIGGSPSFKLDVISTSGTNTVRSYSSAATDARFVAKNNSNETIFGSDSTGSYVTQTANLPFRIVTNNTESLRVLGDGSVGIKTDGTTDAKLHVAGTKSSNIVHLEANTGDYDGMYLQTETLSGQSGGVKWIPNTTPGAGTTEFTTNFSSNTSGGTVQHNVAIGGNLTLNGTGFTKITVGTTAQRPGTASTGMLRYNTTLSQFEGYNGSAWGTIGGGATGGVGSSAFYENDSTITASYTITTGKNAMTAGPVSLDAGVTITVPSGSTWTVV
jgi:hypothetical protein